MRGFQKLGSLLESLHNKDHSMLGSVFGPPAYGSHQVPNIGRVWSRYPLMGARWTLQSRAIVMVDIGFFIEIIYDGPTKVVV